jgi:hypothetical protein
MSVLVRTNAILSLLTFLRKKSRLVDYPVRVGSVFAGRHHEQHMIERNQH